MFSGLFNPLARTPIRPSTRRVGVFCRIGTSRPSQDCLSPAKVVDCSAYYSAARPLEIITATIMGIKKKKEAQHKCNTFWIVYNK